MPALTVSAGSRRPRSFSLSFPGFLGATSPLSAAGQRPLLDFGPHVQRARDEALGGCNCLGLPALGAAWRGISSLASNPATLELEAVAYLKICDGVRKTYVRENNFLSCPSHWT